MTRAGWPIRSLTAAAMLALTLMSQPVALAQVGLGAERYEVTITPPKRPGSAPAASATEPAAAAADTTPSAARAAPAVSDSAVQPAPSPGGNAAATASAALDPALARAAANAPPHTLQVGAYRQSASASSLRDKLTASFADVNVVEVQSGGEPLYRVYVGRLPHGAALDEVKRRLVAAGYPAFEVPAPGASAPD